MTSIAKAQHTFSTSINEPAAADLLAVPPPSLSPQTLSPHRPTMQARDAEGSYNDGGLNDLVSFLRDTAPESAASSSPRESVQSLSASKGSSRLSTQGSLVKRVFRVSSRRSAAASFQDSLTPGLARTGVAVEKITPSGHKYISITPIDEDPTVDTRRDTDNLPTTSPFNVDTLARPKTAGALLPGKTNVPAKTFMSQFETDMQRRWQNVTSSTKLQPSLRPSRTAEELKSSLVKPPQKDITSGAKLTPPDSDISAFLRATLDPPKYRTRPPTPSKIFLTHPIEPPSPAPQGPLPDLPAERAFSVISSGHSLGEPAHEVITEDPLDHHVFRSSTDLLRKQTTPSERSMPLSLLALHDAPHVPKLSEDLSDQEQTQGGVRNHTFSSSARMPNTSAPRPSTANTLLSSSDKSILQKRPGTSGTMQSHSGLSSFSSRPETPGSREERTRMRKLRHLKTGKTNPLTTPDPSPVVSQDVTPSQKEVPEDEAKFAVPPTLVSVDQSPVSSLPPSRPRDETTTIPFGPDSLHSSSFPDQQSTSALPTRPSTAGSSDPFSLSPAIRLLTANNQHRISAISSVSQPRENQSHHRAISLTSESSTRSRITNSIQRLPRSALNAHIAHLERQNDLLEAALMAVLKTGGMLNGCPCQAESRMAKFDAGRAPLSGASSATTRENLLSEAAENALGEVRSRGRDSIATAASAGSKTSSPGEAFDGEKSDIKVIANTSASRETKGRESRALALYIATRLDLGAKRTASLGSDAEDEEQTLTEGWVA